MSFKDGDLVWAKIKGYPYWPAKVLARSKAPPKVLKSEHRSSDLLVRFFGKPVTYGWMLAKDLQSFIGHKADTKSTSKKLSYAIDEAIRHEKQLKQGVQPSDSSDSSDSSDEESSQEDSSESPREEIQPKKRGRRAKSRDESKSASKQNGKIEDKARDQRMMKREQARKQSRAAELTKKPRGRPSRGSDTPVKSVKTETVKEEKQPAASNAKNSSKQSEKQSASTKNVSNDKANHTAEHNHKSASRDKNSSNDRSTSPVRRDEKKKPIYRMEDTPANHTTSPANDSTPPKKRKRDSDEDDSHESKKRRTLAPSETKSGETKSGETKSGETKSGETKSGELTLDKLNAYKVSLRATIKEQHEGAAVRLLHKLKSCNVTLELLQKSKIGKTVKEYQQHPNKEVAQLCTEIFDSYLRLYKAEFGLNGSLEPSSSEDRK
eukprot:TRINITY_DN563_c0_g1_i1.p1 TRINITY_DN563_c0_g1~~TRINITY_DN563_c0_g1_i1.p1  ORF type:complete len:435 (+),score=146.35 TRINITY_DN563_c0_g1_i1:71-1375(+)